MVPDLVGRCGRRVPEMVHTNRIQLSSDQAAPTAESVELPESVDIPAGADTAAVAFG